VAAKDQAISGVPGRYAAALFELASDSNAIDKTGSDLSSIKKMLDGSPDLKRLVRSPLFDAGDQQSALEAICSKAGISGLTYNFIRLLAKNRRLAALEPAIQSFHLLMAEARGEVAAEVTSAEKLSDKHVRDLKAALKATIGQDVQLATKVDKTILGGLIVRVGSRMMDNSLRTKLQNLKIAMKGTG
jgi:F-type H+-transporting ATPase subunit delta